jgi:hypothetical protein
VIAPGAVAGDVRAALALAGGGDRRAAHVDGGQVEEGVGLPLPGALADLVEDILQGVEARRGEAAAEIAGRRGVRDAAGAQGIKEGLVVAAQLDVVEAAALTRGVVGDVEGVVGFVIGQVDLEQVQLLVDGPRGPRWQANAWAAPMPPWARPRVRSAIS